MKKQIKKISIHQTSKVISLNYFVISAIIFIPMGIFQIFSGHGAESLFAFIAPFLYLLFGYIAISLFSWIYNLIASSFGGVEFTFQDIEERESVQNWQSGS